MTNKAFERVVRKTIQSLPREFLTQLDNVAIFIEEVPPPNSRLLGLYRGVPNNVRLGHFALPDTITIYKQPLLAMSSNDRQAKENIRNTVLHEIGHHFGLTDKELYAIQNAAKKK